MVYDTKKITETLQDIRKTNTNMYMLTVAGLTLVTVLGICNIVKPYKQNQIPINSKYEGLSQEVSDVNDVNDINKIGFIRREK